MDWRDLDVLVVDDSAHMRHIVMTIVRSIGFRSVREAADGADALERLKTQAADLILVDYRMATLDGLEFIQLVRTAPDSPAPNAAIIMLTGHGARSTVEAAKAAGVDGFVVKPLSAQALTRGIERGLAVAADRPPRPVRRPADQAGPDTYEL